MIIQFSIFLLSVCQSTILSIVNTPQRWLPLTGNWMISNQTTSKQIYTTYGLDSYSVKWLLSRDRKNDPLIDYNDVHLKWIGYDNWTFTKTFTIEQYDLNKYTIELYLDNIDTFCEIILNNHVLGITQNSFLSYTWEINNFLNIKNVNKLQLKCISSVLIAKKRAEFLKRMKKSIPLPFCWPKQFHGECYINLIRTTQSIFGWDWGLSLPIQGFWIPPKLLITPFNLRFGELFKFYAYSITTEQVKTVWSSKINIEVIRNDRLHNHQLKGCISSYIKELNVFGRKCFTSREKLITMEVLRNHSNVKQWWPNGVHNGPYLYTLILYLTEGLNIVDRREYSIGFREVELIEDYVDPSKIGLGRTFYFKINGLPIFIKGANWIPARYMPGRQSTLMRNMTTDAFWLEKRLLRSAALSGVNLIRIWGGGRYEDDEFYTEADRLGLMIWHDMMFAVSTYPDKESNDTVEKEIRRQISRLHYHPSIIVWSTDNEVKQAIANGWYRPPMDPHLLGIYKSTFVDSILTVINEEEEEETSRKLINPWTTSKYKPRRCLISSPSNGYLTEKFRGLDPDPDNPHFGDIHFYTYSGDLWSESTFKLARFISEFGLQSIPSTLAWARSMTNISDSKQWNIFGILMEHRQHHPLGNRMLLLPLEYITEPVERQDPIRNYSRWAYISQLNQLMCLRAQINLYMRHKCRLKLSKSTVLFTDKLITMGTIYWQLNDIWSAPSWSTIDSAGQWKLSHYAAIKEFYNIPKWGRIAIHNKDKKIVEADWIPNVQSEDNIIFPSEFELICYTIWSFKPIHRSVLNIPGKTNLQCPITILNITVEDLNKLCHFNDRKGRILQIRMKINSKYTNSDGNLLLLDEPNKIRKWPQKAGKGLTLKSIELVEENDTLSKLQQNAPFQTNHIYKLIIKAESPELFVYLDLDAKLDVEFWFSTNGFHILHERQKTLYLHISVKRRIPIDILKYSIWIESLATLLT